MKTIIVTQQNIHLIKFRIQQFIDRLSSVKVISYYPTSVKRNKELIIVDRLTPKEVEKSYPSFISKDNYELRTTIFRDKKCVYINYMSRGESNGGSIEQGQRFKFTPTHIFQIHPHPTKEKENCKTIWSAGSSDKKRFDEDYEDISDLYEQKEKAQKDAKYKEAVTKAVKWWSEKSFRTLLNQNNGDNSSAGGMTHMLMNMVASKAQEEITDEKINKFESKLTELLMKAERRERTLDVDYDPCRLLAESAQFAGIDSHCFPCKSFTRIDDNNKVYAKYQYGNSQVEI